MAVLQQYKCPCCGGGIEFDPNAQKMKCPYCDTEFDTETLKGYDEDLSKDSESSMEWDLSSSQEWQPGEIEGMRVYSCQSCGGEVVADETTAASECPYCGNPVVMMGQLSGTIKPDLVIPFKLDKAAAKAALMKHVSGKPLLPKVFKDQNHIDEIKGVYVPFWLFDAEAEGTVRYKGTNTRVWSDSNYNYTETSYFSVVRGGSLAFEKIPVDGSTKMADDLMESIEPYHYEDLVDFQTAFLSGYLADKYDVDAEQSIERINGRVKKSTEDAFRSSVGNYATLTPEASSIQLKKGTSKYALLPVWMLNTTWNGQKFTFAMNGQTGRLVGDLPIDKGAYWRWWGLIMALGSVAGFALMSLLWAIGLV